MIEQVRPGYEAAADALADLVGGFEYEKILAALGDGSGEHGGATQDSD
jgi:hypothetical protein